MEVLFVFIGISLSVLISVISMIEKWRGTNPCTTKRYQNKKEKYREYAQQLNESGQKVVYYNETTGTIRYRGKDNRIHSESLYRGYRSHWNG